MLDPIINFFTWIFQMIGKGVGIVIAWLLWPFLIAARWYRQKGWILKTVIGAIIVVVLGGYLYFFYQAAWVRGYDNEYTASFDLASRAVSAGEQINVDGSGNSTRTCGRSAIVDISADLLDFNVNRNQWISATLLYKLGLFGIPWDATPWFDNKASFQRGIHRAVTRTSVELADVLGRVRGSSQIDVDLQSARGNLQIDEFNWYFGLNPPGVKQTAWSSYRQAIKELNDYNLRLEGCSAAFDARADNLMQFLDRVAKDIGSITATIRDRSEQFNGGWFDTRADNLFMEAKGQLYAYRGLLAAARADFEDIVRIRNLSGLWDSMDRQILSALELDPLIISNGKEDGFVMPTHLTTIGFYILRVRTNLTELRDVLRN